MNPQRERRHLFVLTLFSFALLLAMSFLLNACKSKPKPSIAPPVSTRPIVDSTRIRLERQAAGSEWARHWGMQASDSTYTDYYYKLKNYDSLSVQLP